VDANAEATTLPAHSVDFVTAAQAFHWFDRIKAKREFARILKPRGWVVLIWNERRLDSTTFLRAYEDLLLRYGTDYQNVRHEKVTGEIAEFFAPDTFESQTLENAQHFDFESLKGRLLSSSYAPDSGHPNFAAMLKELEEVFNANQQEGTVSFEYETKVYCGRLSQS
jgi:ubiquinone/menaquinone biosynthesis C-methylase UbiE